MAILSATVSNKISCHTCSSSICYMAQHQPVKHVVIPSAHYGNNISYSTYDFPSVTVTPLSIISHVVSISHNNKKWLYHLFTMAWIISHQNHMAITSANNIRGGIHYDNYICHNEHKQVGLPCVNNKNGKNK